MNRATETGEHVACCALTPGHTKGCTTWAFQVQDSGKSYDVVVVGSVNLNAAVLVNNKDYPQIQDDYIHSFQVLKGLHCDVFVASHTGMYRMAEKYAQREKDPAGANPYIDPEGYRAACRIGGEGVLCSGGTAQGRKITVRDWSVAMWGGQSWRRVGGWAGLVETSATR